MYCPICSSIIGYNIEQELFKCTLLGCIFEQKPSFENGTCLFSKMLNFDFVENSDYSKKFIDDSTIYTGNTCDICKTPKKVIIMGQNHPVIEICNCV